MTALAGRWKRVPVELETEELARVCQHIVHECAEPPWNDRTAGGRYSSNLEICPAATRKDRVFPDFVDACEIDQLAEVADLCTAHASVKLEGGLILLKLNNLMLVLFR